MRECIKLMKMRQRVKEMKNWKDMSNYVYPLIHIEHSAPIESATQIQLNGTQQ